MLSSKQEVLLLERFVELIELPDSAYERAKERYEDIGEYLGRPGSKCKPFHPHIFPQGSFRLGTAIQPLHKSEAYDLDLSCELISGISTATHTQRQLKELVGGELHSYRSARHIEQPVQEKHRCWRIEYADAMNFHMDVVPSIPADQSKRLALGEAMIRTGRDRVLSASVSNLAVLITDDRRDDYDLLTPEWQASNPAGYAEWFEARMRPQESTLVARKTLIEELPAYRRKTPLQRTVQLLKRHRDQMFKNHPEVKPISIILTTLAAEGYDGSASLEVALRAILRHLSQFADSGGAFVPNPVNPEENFADKWKMPEHRHLRLRDNFVAWVNQANADFAAFNSNADVSFLAEHASDRLAVTSTPAELGSLLGVSVGPSIHVGKSHEVRSDAPKPWSG